jgi:hypothetical protein
MIVSTFGEEMAHNFGSSVYNEYDFYCADTYRSGLLLTEHLGYGLCTGTSMSAPHVSGIAAILRSVNPLLEKEAIRSLITDYATTPANNHRNLIPNALDSVKAALGTADGETLINRLTPLFELYSSEGEDYLFTSSPQAAMSALYHSLPPQPAAGSIKWWTTQGVGETVPGYEKFPAGDYAWWWDKPKASFYVFTTHRHPTDENGELIPLYRLSINAPTSSNVYNVDHAYVTQQVQLDAAESAGYDLDGIEGYIYPAGENHNQPPGTVGLYSRYNPSRDDHVLVPEPYLSTMTSRGYTVNSPDNIDVMGYVYLNKDSDGDTLIDGFETIIGTDPSIKDSDEDGIIDGIEVNRFPYSDPLVP